MKRAAMLLLTACSTAPNPIDAARPTTMEAALAPPVLGMLRAAILDAPTTMPYVRLIYGRSACAGHRGINPLAIVTGPPVAGREFRVLFVTSACPVPAEPDWQSWLIVSTRPLAQPIDFSPYGSPGCWLVTNPDQIVAVPPVTGGMFLRSGGKTTLLWTPSAASVGQSHWFQFIVASPSGWLASPGVECTVGSAP